MKLLLDSHTLLWFVGNLPALSARAKSLIEDPANQKVVSLASCWEIAIKAATGKLRLAEPAAILLPREIAVNNFDLLPISLAHAMAVESLPMHHRDPFDRLLIVQAFLEGLTVVGADFAFDQYGVARAW